ncbi:A-kinase anchor protein 7 [Strongylocentrotus purpuratus]|uniref:A-kinase anchor protein 7-like phosphoesterase domain-containing protein n=1 Tax=Strongylocentrotus purpuratus TaxID=7668 RepID=A0A7M7NPP8_STRPU|nr:A-kinase anchor protein 7 [Strongylocentrotus purpuratus]
MVDGDTRLREAMVPIPSLHLTIMVMHLATDDDVDRAKEALIECNRLLGYRIPEIKRRELNISFQGLDNFNNRVVFAKIRDIDGILDTLDKVAETVKECYKIKGIKSTDTRRFNPHLTVVKLSRDSVYKTGVRSIKSELYCDYSDTLFGNQPVSGFQLCSMSKPKSDDGYYYKEHEVLF